MRGFARSLAAVIALFAACAVGSPTHRAEATLAGTTVRVSVILTHSHPYLAEYARTHVVEGLSSSRAIELFPDTDGYARVNLYEHAGGFVVVTGGRHDYVLDLLEDTVAQVKPRTVEISTSGGGFRIHHLPPTMSEFIGSFDFNSQREWRYIVAAERGEVLVGAKNP